MTPLGLIGVLLATAYAMIRRWERLQQRERARNHESQPAAQPEPAPQDAPVPGKRAWWKRILGNG